jgi:hypothetical protein
MAVTAIAERAGFRMFATTPRDGFCVGNIYLERPEAAAFVRTVAKRLAFGLAARAPPKGARLNLLHKWKSLGDDWFHNARTIFQLLQKANCFCKNIPAHIPTPVRLGCTGHLPVGAENAQNAIKIA